MEIKHLGHRHGGRITNITAIAHITYQRRASWHFLGDVEWSDGSKSKGLEISPICLCRDPDNPEAQAELDAVMNRLNAYLARNGEWRQHGWKAKCKQGREEVLP